MAYLIDSRAFKTKRGILSHVQQLNPLAHEVFFNQGDILLLRKGETLAMYPGRVLGNGDTVFASPKFYAPRAPETKQYQPKTGQACSCRRGQERDNCPACEGTGQRVDFAAIRAAAKQAKGGPQ